MAQFTLVNVNVRQTVSHMVLLLLATLGQNCAQVFQRNCQWDLNETSHVCSWVESRKFCKILLTFTNDLDFKVMTL